MKEFIIFCPFRRKFHEPTGSNIRIHGYTEPLNELSVKYKFVSPEKPDYIEQSHFIPFKLSLRLKKIFLLHNIFYSKTLLNPFSYLIYLFLHNIKDIQNIITLSKDNIIISHQENSIILFLVLRLKIRAIYDIHGILDIQREYMDNLTFWKKLWFKIQLLNEKLVFKYIPEINVVSNAMKVHILNRCNYKGKIHIAPDGLLYLPDYQDNIIFELKTLYNISKSDRIIMFFGSFKKFGGVHFLVEAFIEISRLFPTTKLVLIGKGQMENYVYKIMNNHNLKDKIIHIPSVPYENLQNHLQLAEIIVIPDMKNVYNEITPHIKLFDSIASNKTVVLPGFRVNVELLEPVNNRNKFFEASDLDNLIRVIKNSLISGKEINNQRINNLEKFLYKNHAKKYFSKTIQAI